MMRIHTHIHMHICNDATTYLQVKYTGYRDRPIEERRNRFKSDIINGHAEIVSNQ